MAGFEAIRLRPKVSWYLAGWLGGLHLLSQLVLLRLPGDPLARGALSALLILYLIWQVRHHLLRTTRRAIREVLLDTDGRVWLLRKDSCKTAVEVSAESFVTPWLLVLVFKTDQRFNPSSLILPPDSLDSEVARRLRMHLLQKGISVQKEPGS